MLQRLAHVPTHLRLPYSVFRHRFGLNMIVFKAAALMEEVGRTVSVDLWRRHSWKATSAPHSGDGTRRCCALDCQAAEIFRVSMRVAVASKVQAVLTTESLSASCSFLHTAVALLHAQDGISRFMRSKNERQVTSGEYKGLCESKSIRYCFIYHRST